MNILNRLFRSRDKPKSSSLIMYGPAGTGKTH